MRNRARPFIAEITHGVKRRVLDRAEAGANECAGAELAAAGAQECAAEAQQARARDAVLNYEPFPKPRQFHSSPAKYRLFGGSAGPGKTKALLMAAVLQATEHPM